MRSVLLSLPLLFAPAMTGKAPPPACGDAALAEAPDAWNAESVITGDLTLDGKADVAFWKREGNAVMVYIAACDGDRMVQHWRFRIALAADCPPTAAAVEMASLVIDPAAVERVCTTGDKSECEHLRRENRVRQAITDAGGRELRVIGAACAGPRLRWSTHLGGFVRMS